MRVLVTGAYGLIGAACLAHLYATGHDVVAAGRDIRSARRRFPFAQWVAADFNKLADAPAWLPLLQGVDGVVNCVGVLQDGLRDDVRRVQLEGTKALFDGCVRAGVKRVVHVSAIGAEPDGPSEFSRSKAGAEAYLRELPLDWVILRPALVLGPAVYGGTAMLRGLAAFPGIVPIVHADARIQVIGLDDLAETVARALAPDAPARTVWDVAHPQVHRLPDIVTAIRGWLGFPPRRVLALPDALAKIVGLFADALGWLGWRSPARSTSLAQLTAGVIGDPARWMAETGIAPKNLDQILAARPAGVQDRWFARLYLLKPLAIVGLAASLASVGTFELIRSCKWAVLLWGHAVPAVFAEQVLPEFIGGLLNFVLGLAIIVRRIARPSLIVLIFATVLGIVSNTAAELSSMRYPITVFAYGVPGLLALLFALAILDDR
jgi:uncharacterized protein YbjT (DUF2867 family)